MSWQDEEREKREEERREEERKKAAEEQCKLEINKFWDKLVKATYNINPDIRPEIKNSNIIGKNGLLKFCNVAIEGFREHDYGITISIEYDTDKEKFYVVRSGWDSCENAHKKSKLYEIDNKSIEIILKNLCTGKRFYEGLKPYKENICFIATAVYESSKSPEVLMLQSFRDKVLLQSIVGRTLVRIYYYYSPPIARAISRNVRIRKHIKRF